METSKRKEECCFYIVPNYLIGEPLYDVNMCIIYIMRQLIDGKFSVLYTHPNLLFISWRRDEHNEYDIYKNNATNKQIKYFNDGRSITYKPVENYRPSKKLIYDMSSMGNKIDDIF